MKTLPFFLLTLVVGCDDNSAELSKLNSEIKILSDRTVEYETQIQEIKLESSTEKARTDNEKIELVSKIKNFEITLKNLSNEIEAFEQKEEQLNRIVAYLEEQKMKTAQEHQVFIDTLTSEHKEQLAGLQDEIRKAESEGYKRGVDIMLETYRESNQTSDNSPSIQEKLKLIKIPGVQFFNASLSEVMEVLHRQSIKFDLITSSVASRGVNILVANQDKDEPRVHITLNSMPLENILQFITNMIGWNLEVHEDGVYISKPPKVLSRLETEHFKITPELLMLIVRAQGGADNDRDPFVNNDPDPFAVNSKRKPELLDTGRTIREFLEQEGIPFHDSEGHKFSFNGSDLIVSHEREALDRIKRIIIRTLRQTRYDELKAGE
jgi:hypothetical protein